MVRVSGARRDALFDIPSPAVLPVRQYYTEKCSTGRRECHTAECYRDQFDTSSKQTKCPPIRICMTNFIIGEDMKRLVREAFQFWEDNTCLTFEENGTNTPVLTVTKAGGCWSSLGLQLGQESQTISLNKDCALMGPIAHEIAHALSIDHTMTRPDRDQYIGIDLTNILKQNHYNFVKLHSLRTSLNR
ncbi:astacin [Ancylostoma ceylanicum]|uniref:Metalloendopeptidase n=1 Tax=Ancylostoma ceylanicum TaxID=53326 RepID=A0A0D6LMC2_9BILA|nr:astacin [Ancylostoma ceylanicum]